MLKAMLQLLIPIFVLLFTLIPGDGHFRRRTVLHRSATVNASSQKKSSRPVWSNVNNFPTNSTLAAGINQ